MRILRVLIAEDDSDAALTLSALLRDEGHEVRAVGSGPQVMSEVMAFDPDAVLLDIHLPGLNGWDVARTLRERFGNARPLLIGLSGVYKHGADRILSRIVGFDHYFVKPYPAAELMKLLQT